MAAAPVAHPRKGIYVMPARFVSSPTLAIQTKPAKIIYLKKNTKKCTGKNYSLQF
jgi:hypothetical protein